MSGQKGRSGRPKGTLSVEELQKLSERMRVYNLAHHAQSEQTIARRSASLRLRWAAEPAESPWRNHASEQARLINMLPSEHLRRSEQMKRLHAEGRIPHHTISEFTDWLKRASSSQ